MTRGIGVLGTRVRQAREWLISDLGEVFGKWLELPDTFGHPIRKRLFSPLADVLAIPLPDSLTRGVLSRGGEEVPRVVGSRR